ncbi:MAG: hypothetical protein ACRDCJ_01710 [Metamycoplasmataceae bacterium]
MNKINYNWIAKLIIGDLNKINEPELVTYLSGFNIKEMFQTFNNNLILEKVSTTRYIYTREIIEKFTDAELSNFISWFLIYFLRASCYDEKEYQKKLSKLIEILNFQVSYIMDMVLKNSPELLIYSNKTPSQTPTSSPTFTFKTKTPTSSPIFKTPSQTPTSSPTFTFKTKTPTSSPTLTFKTKTPTSSPIFKTPSQTKELSGGGYWMFMDFENEEEWKYDSARNFFLSKNIELKRMDKSYHTQDNDKAIIENISKAIKEADFCIFDISTKNPNVFHELGRAQALKKKHIILCTKSNIKNVPFNVKAHKIEIYETPKDINKILEKHSNQ